jgi:hypothetical protein
MINTLVKNWWLLALCGVLQLAISSIYAIMERTGGPVLWQSWHGTIELAGKLGIAAGLCAIAAALWRSRNGRSWGLALNGVALAALGFIQYALTRFPISIVTVAALMVVMAVSMALVELEIARDFRRRRQVGDGWFFGLAGIVAVAIVVPFVALALRWVALQPGSHVDLLWLACYFGVAAVSMMALAARLHRQGYWT